MKTRKVPTAVNVGQLYEFISKRTGQSTMDLAWEFHGKSKIRPVRSFYDLRVLVPKQAWLSAMRDVMMEHFDKRKSSEIDPGGDHPAMILQKVEEQLRGVTFVDIFTKVSD